MIIPLNISFTYSVSSMIVLTPMSHLVKLWLPDIICSWSRRTATFFLPKKNHRPLSCRLTCDVKANPWHSPVTVIVFSYKIFRIITARKRSLRRLCFYTCLSFCLQRGWYPSMPCRSPWGVFQHTPSPGAVHAGRYSQQAGSTHPTGMNSCHIINLTDQDQ